MTTLPDVQLRHEMVSVGPLKLHVAQAGPPDGPLVILLHGFPEFWYGWRRQIGPLAAAGYRVWVPDQRGYNLSDKPTQLAAYSLDRLVEDVTGLIDAAGVQRASVIGHDWGAAVAWWAAITRPERLDRVGILNVPHPVVMQRHLCRSLGQLRKSWYMFFFQLPRLPERMFLKGDCRRTLRGIQKTGRPGSITDEDLEHYRQAWQQPGAMTGMINWYRAALRRPPAKPRSIRVTVPLLMIWGEQDPFLDAAMAPPSIDLCDQAQLKTFPQATHWVQHDEAEKVNELLLEFLEGGQE